MCDKCPPFLYDCTQSFNRRIKVVNKVPHVIMEAWGNVLICHIQTMGVSLGKTHLFPFGQANPKFPIII